MPDDVKLHDVPKRLFSDSLLAAERLNHIAGEFLLVDAETAQTLLDVAEMSLNGFTAQKGFSRASEALATINHFLGRLDLDADLRAEIELARDQLRDRLKTMWPQFRLS